MKTGSMTKDYNSTIQYHKKFQVESAPWQYLQNAYNKDITTKKIPKTSGSP